MCLGYPLWQLIKLFQVAVFEKIIDSSYANSWIANECPLACFFFFLWDLTVSTMWNRLSLLPEIVCVAVYKSVLYSDQVTFDLQNPFTFIVKAVTFLGGKEGWQMFQQTTHLAASNMLWYNFGRFCKRTSVFAICVFGYSVPKGKRFTFWVG